MDIDSFLHLYQQSYYNLPRPVKTFLGSLYGNIPLRIRFGKQYNVFKEAVEKFMISDEQYQLDFMFNKTYETIKFAEDHIPYYQKLFNEYSFSSNQFRSFSDLEKLPFLTKEIIQKEIDNLYTDKFDKPVPYFTGGSSSTPMKIYAPIQISRSKEKAYTNYIFGQTGYIYRDKTVAIKGRDSADETKGIYWEYQMVDNQLLISGNHLQSRYIETIVEEILRYKPEFFYGYPSAILAFIKACKLKDIDTIENIEGVFLISESVFPEYIDTIKSFFNCVVLSHYGHTERTTLAYRLDHGPYQFMNSYGLTRIVDDEIIATSFDNFVMPYINYRTKDYIDGERLFYRDTDIVKVATTIQGRIQEYVITKDGDPISILSIGAGHYDSYNNVEMAQFYQERPGFVTLYIQSSEPDKVDTDLMTKQMESQVKHKIKFNILFKDKIEKSKRGKRILCVQKLDIEKYRR